MRTTTVRAEDIIWRPAQDSEPPYNPVRCWADSNSILTNPRALSVECQAVGDGPLGLCERHATEILG